MAGQSAADRKHEELMEAIRGLGSVARTPTQQTITQDSRLSIAFAVILAGALVTSVVNFMGLKGEVTTLNASIENLRITVTKLEDFAGAPRFTRNDFDTETKPIHDAIDRNTAQLERREGWMTDIEGRVRDLEYANGKRD